ncbi:MAG: hypothetical protein ACRDIC_01030, partial [bacterium]
ALRKAFIAAGFPADLGRTLLLSVGDRDKADAADFASAAARDGFDLLATPGTAAALAAHGVLARMIRPEEAVALARSRNIDVVVNTPTHGWRRDRPGFMLRRAASELNVPLLTSLETARAMLEAFAPATVTDLVPLGS